MSEPETIVTEPIAPPPTDARLARVARGARHVRVGLALGAIGALTLVGSASAGGGAGPALGPGNFIAALLMGGVLAAAVLSASRIARALVLVWGLLFVLAASGLAAALLLAPGRPWPLAVPPWLMAGATGLAGIGSLLATATPSADAWYEARRAARRARGAAKPLAEWRREALVERADIGSR